MFQALKLTIKCFSIARNLDMNGDCIGAIQPACWNGELKMPKTEKPSKTAELVAAARASHTRTAKPPIFADEYAEHLCGPIWRTIISSKFLTWLVVKVKLHVVQPIVMAVFVRARFCEDLVEEAIDSSVNQYVILGAGYDSFAMRRADLKNKVTVFELDQFATQKSKLERMAKHGIAKPDNAVYVGADLNVDDMFECLNQHGFDSSKPAVFAWFGVTYYLKRDSVVSTLQQISSTCSPGSSVLFDFQFNPFSTPKDWRHIQSKMIEFVAKKGEPMITRFKPENVEKFVQDCGYANVEVLLPKDINNKYLSNREDKLSFPPIFGLCNARIG